MSIKSAMGALGTVAGVASLFSGNKSSSNSKITNFQAEIRKSGVARTNLFEVVFTVPRVITGGATAQKLSLYAESAQIPGRQINTGNIQRFGVGPSEKVPYGMSFNDVTINFIGDGQGEIYKFFYNWMHGIVRGDYDAFTYETQQDKNSKKPFNVEFKENYAVPIDIITYNEKNETVLYSRLTYAFPVNVADVSLNWSDGSLMSFAVTFTFLQAQLNDAEKPIKASDNTLKQLSTLQKLIKVGTAVQTLAALRKPSNIQGAIASATSVKNVINGF